MSKVAVRLFRNHSLAQKAVAALQEQGYTWGEIGILMGEEAVGLFPEVGNEFSQARGVLSPDALSVVGLGPVAAAIQGVGDGLANFLGIPDAVFDYYRTGISLGGVLVSLHVEESRIPQVRAILRAAANEASPEPRGRKTTSPGFDAAQRVTETDPLDAKFTGDFRRY